MPLLISLARRGFILGVCVHAYVGHRQIVINQAASRHVTEANWISLTKAVWLQFDFSSNLINSLILLCKHEQAQLNKTAEEQLLHTKLHKVHYRDPSDLFIFIES